MKKVLGVISLLISLLFVMTSCDDKEYDYEIHDPMFITYFAKEDRIDDIDIIKLDSYYYKKYYYYVVDFKEEKVHGDKVLEILYILKYGYVTFFNIQNEQSCLTYFYTYYNNYLEAKENGIKREYTNDEIDEMIKKAYPNENNK